MISFVNNCYLDGSLIWVFFVHMVVFHDLDWRQAYSLTSFVEVIQHPLQLFCGARKGDYVIRKAEKVEGVAVNFHSFIVPVECAEDLLNADWKEF